MLQYLFAAFSLKQTVSEGLSAETLVAVQRWRRTLLGIGGQEMLHLALVQNLLTAVGAAPRLARPNFPMPAYSYPAGVRIELLPFGEAALRHFAFLERPEGMDVEDAEGFEAIAQAVALPHDDEDEIVPHLQEFDTIGQLYRSIQAGLEHLAERLGPERLFIGPPNAQATEEHFRWPELVAVTDLASAHRAIDTIVEQGEGARGEWRDAHFGRLLGDPRRVPRDQAGRPGLRAGPAGRGGQRPAPGDRRRGAADHRSGNDPLHGPAQRRLRGPAPAPVALLRPHRRDTRAARGPRRRLGRADVRRRSSRSGAS